MAERLGRKLETSYLYAAMLTTLAGMPGSGKTTVGRIVADALGCPFLDLDALVEKKAGKSVQALFAEEGEPAFRKVEGQVLRQTVAKYAESDAVLALGGGSVTLPGAVALLQEKTLCIWLRTRLETLEDRLKDTIIARPLLAEPGALARLLAEREALYEAAAHITLDTDGASPEEIADEIIISVL